MSSSRKVFSRAAVALRRAAGRRLEQQVGFGQQKRSAAGLHPPDQTKAYLFGRGPGHKPEGWEGIMLATWISSAAILFVGVGMGPETSIKEWARDEALARDIREARGQPVEYGNIYSQGTMYAFKPESGDDDDEEDEEDEEE